MLLTSMYRNKLADHVDRAPAEKGQAAKQTASGHYGKG
jgi:hypothetical protein